MDKIKEAKKPVRTCGDCIHEFACRMWTDGRMISDRSASRCPNHKTVKASAAYLCGLLDGRAEAVMCKDCKHNGKNGGDCNRMLSITSRDYVLELNMTEYIVLDSCSHGERKEE